MVFLWNANDNAGDFYSVLDYVETHSERLRAKYLAFIHEFGLYEVGSKSIVEHLSDGRGYNLWWMSKIAEKSYLNSPHITDCIKLFALEEMLKEAGANSLVVFGNDESSPVYKAICSLCGNLNSSCTYRFVGVRRKKSSKQFLLRYRPELVSVFRYLIRYVKSHWTVFNKKTIKWQGRDNSILFFSYLFHVDAEKCNKGEFYSKQWGTLPSTLESLGLTTNWMHHDWAIDSADTAQRWIDSFNNNLTQQDNHALFENYLSISFVLAAVLNYFHFFLKSFFLFDIPKAFQPADSAVNLWPLLKDDWRVSLRGGVAARNCLFIQAVDNVLKDAPKQRLGLYVQENMYWERALLHGWYRYDHGRIIGVPLATINFWDIRYAEDVRSVKAEKTKLTLPMPDQVALHGPVAEQYYNEAGYPMGITTGVEALRYLYLDKIQPTGHDSNSSQKEGQVKIIVLGELNGNSTMEMLNVVNDAVSGEGHISVTLKPHPVCPTKFEKFDLSLTFKPIAEILFDYDLAVVAGSTSAAIDVYYSGIGLVVYLGNSDLNLSPLRNFTDVTFVRTSDELKGIIKSLGYNSQTISRKEYFYLDNNLSRWKSLISSQLNS